MFKRVKKFSKKFVGGIEQDAKTFTKQLTADNPVLVKNENIAILIYSGKTHKAFLEEFEKLTIDGYKLSGITDPRGIPLLGEIPILGNTKYGKIFFFQHLPSKQW